MQIRDVPGFGNVRIGNVRHLDQADADNYCVRDGIVVIPQRAVVPDGTVI